MKKTTLLRRMLHSPEPEFLLGAHNGLSSKLVEEAGFRGIWASGLEISASLGVRDNNEASWTQVLEVVEFMSDATRIPILIDADTGYGNFNNARRLVRKLEQRDVAGMCIEDKLFPKTNSFINSEGQKLASIEEFTGKIKAVKDTQSDPDFCLVARVEAFLAGYGLDEALRRAHAYHEAGADAVLIHSKRPTAVEVLGFMEQWTAECPVVIVPTCYFDTPPEAFERAGISLVIWANHMLRSSITAMQETAARLHAARSLREIEPAIVPLAEVFRLQNHAELEAAERLYLPGGMERAARTPLRPAAMDRPAGWREGGPKSSNGGPEPARSIARPRATPPAPAALPADGTQGSRE